MCLCIPKKKSSGKKRTEAFLEGLECGNKTPARY